MKAWLARAVEGTVQRGEHRRNRFARWSHWFPPTPTVERSAFQSDTEPYPRHWRRFPNPWPQRETDDPTVRAQLRDALVELPEAWRDVVQRRDVEGRAAEAVSRELGITDAQQRRMLNRARAQLRRRVAERLTDEDR